MNGSKVLEWAFGFLGWVFCAGILLGLFLVLFGDHSVRMYRLDNGGTDCVGTRWVEIRAERRWCGDTVILRDQDVDKTLQIVNQLNEQLESEK